MEAKRKEYGIIYKNKKYMKNKNKVKLTEFLKEVKRLETGQYSKKSGLRIFQFDLQHESSYFKKNHRSWIGKQKINLHVSILFCNCKTTKVLIATIEERLICYKK